MALALALSTWLVGGVVGAQESPFAATPTAPAVIPAGSYAPPMPPYVPPPEPPHDGAPGFVFRGELLANYRYALRESWGSGGFEIYLGGEHGRLGIAGTAALEGGRSAAGLSFLTANIGLELAARVTERFRLGINPHFGGIFIEDATDGEWNMAAAMFGVNIDGTFDLWRRKGNALYVVAKVGIDYIDVSADSKADEGALGTFNYALSCTASLGLGVRL